jgi:hypothetical protein
MGNTDTKRGLGELDAKQEMACYDTCLIGSCGITTYVSRRAATYAQLTSSGHVVCPFNSSSFRPYPITDMNLAGDLRSRVHSTLHLLLPISIREVAPV